nr:MAG: hypothetical protein DIU60_23160 [Actinomycetota bacterium]
MRPAGRTHTEGCKASGPETVTFHLAGRRNVAPSGVLVGVSEAPAEGVAEGERAGDAVRLALGVAVAAREGVGVSAVAVMAFGAGESPGSVAALTSPMPTTRAAIPMATPYSQRSRRERGGLCSRWGSSVRGRSGSRVTWPAGTSVVSVRRSGTPSERGVPDVRAAGDPGRSGSAAA